MTVIGHHERAAPRCGSCCYDTTGLTSLTCPECGADLRVAGITHDRSSPSFSAFVISLSALGLVLMWALCGIILVSAVVALVPPRQHVQQTVRLGGPRSGAYTAVDVVATGWGWPGERPTVAVELQLVPGAAGGAAKPRPPLAASRRTTTDDVLAWLSAAGADASDPRVRDEAQAVNLAALRAVRTRVRFGTGGFTSSSVSGIGGRPFTSLTTSVRGGSTRSELPRAIFLALWVGVLVAGVVYLWRAMRPRTVTQHAPR